jgi:hypothetical protein
MPPGWVVPGAPSTNRTTPAYGPQDPVIEFYSTQNGSGGNVTWDVTLPVDRNATANQSDLYQAVEFGMIVTAPSAWMDQCYLQLQLYPDASWYGTGRDNGNWIGVVIGWQIQAATGVEDPCFYSPLYESGVKGSGYLNLTQGDRLNVTMTGWPGNPSGELVTIQDLTHTENESFATAFNATGSYPLDPAYAANDVPDALQWGTGGDLPVFFAMVTGRGGNPTVPDNNSIGGCSPGLPPSTASNPAVPCPSYDPGSWVNDTLHPWEIDPPTFFNVSVRSGTPAQVSFSQAYGGLDELAVAEAACAGRIGSAYCSYPWFSYSCGSGAFEFGATDFPGVSDDFGEYNEYSQTVQRNAAGLAYYPAEDHSIPTCGGPSYALMVGPASPDGTVEFLDHNYSTVTPVSDLAPGEYVLTASHVNGAWFGHWSWSGGVVPSSPNGSWTTLTVTGNGSVSAVYNTGDEFVAVTFDDSPSGEIAIYGAPTPLTQTTQTVGASSAIDLETGVYSILAYPPQGFAFTGWKTSGAGFAIATPSLPFTWLVVTGAEWTGSVTASYGRSPQLDRIGLAAFDTANATFRGGTVSLGGFLTTNSKIASGWIAVGTYNLTASAAPGFTFGGWYYTQSSLMINFSATTNITLENGTLNKSTPAGVVLAIFNPNPVPVTFTPVLGSGGAVVETHGYVRLGGSVNLIPGKNYTISAAPAGGWGFVTWGSTTPKSVWNRDSGSWTEQLVVNRSGTVLVTFAAGSPAILTFHIIPADAGQIEFNGDNTYADGGTNSSVIAGETYLDGVVVETGYTFSRWSTSGAVTVGQATSPNSTVTVSGSGDLNVSLVPVIVPVTFLVSPEQFGTLEVNGSTITGGSTLLLPPGSYTVSATSAAGTFDSWSVTSNLTLADVGSNSTTLTVVGSGTVTALITPFTVAAPSITPAPVDVGTSVSFGSTAPGGGSFAEYTAVWSGLPAGCTTDTTADTFTCAATAPGHYTVAVTFTDEWGEPATSPAVTLRVNALPTLTGATATYTTVDLGVQTNLSSVVDGGTKPYAWSYSDLPAGCSTGDAEELSCSPSAVGQFNVTITVTDKFGNAASGVVTLVVNALPSVKISTSTSSPTVGKSLSVTAAVLGGTGPFSYSYTGLPTGCPTTTSASFTCVPTAAGTYHINVTASDAFGKAASEVLTVVVAAAPSSTFNLEDVEIGLGLVVLIVIALAVFVALRRRPKKPAAVAPAVVVTPLPKIAPPSPRPPLPEWSEEPPPPNEWQEGQ